MNAKRKMIFILPVIAYAALIGMTITPTVRSAMARLMMNMFDT